MSPQAFNAMLGDPDSLLHGTLDSFAHIWQAAVSLTPPGRTAVAKGTVQGTAVCAVTAHDMFADPDPKSFECDNGHVHVRVPTTLGVLDVTSVSLSDGQSTMLREATEHLAGTINRIGTHPDALVVADVATALAELDATLSFQDVMCRVLDIVGDRICFDYGNITRVDHTRDELEVIAHKTRPNSAQTGNSLSIPPLRWSVNTGVTGSVTRSRTPALIDDVATIPHFLRHWPHTRSELACPLIIGDKVVAVLNLESQHMGHFTEHHLDLVLKIAPIIAVAVERAEQRENLGRKDRERRVREERIAELHKIALPFAKASEAQLLQDLAEGIVRLFPNYDLCAIRLNDSGRDQLPLMGVGPRDMSPHVIQAVGRSIPGTNSLSGRAIRERRPVKAYDLANNADFFDPSFARLLALKGMLVVPIASHDSDDPLGCLAAYTKSASYKFQPDDETLLKELADFVAVSLSHARMSLVLAAREETSQCCRHSPKSRSTLDAISRLSRDKIGAQGASIFLLEQGRLRLKGTTGVLRACDRARVSDYAEAQYGLGEGKTGFVAKRNVPLRIVEESELRQFALGSPKYLEDIGESGDVHNFLAVPVRSNDRVAGVIRAAGKVGGLRFTPRDQDILSAVADQLGAALSLEEDTDAAMAAIAHQLTYPLESVRESCEEMLGTESPLADGHAEVVRTILSQCQLAGSLVNNVTTARHVLDDPDFELNLKPLDLIALIGESVAHHWPLARRRRVQIENMCENVRDFPAVDGDRTLLAQVLFNLLHNAVIYSRGDRPIRIYPYGTDSRLCTICIQNYGFRIRRHERELIFERGYRSDIAKASMPTGSGLGLALARAIARRHFGDILVDSVLDINRVADTRFYLALPLRQPSTH